MLNHLTRALLQNNIGGSELSEQHNNELKQARTKRCRISQCQENSEWILWINFRLFYQTSGKKPRELRSTQINKILISNPLLRKKKKWERICKNALKQVHLNNQLEHNLKEQRIMKHRHYLSPHPVYFAEVKNWEAAYNIWPLFPTEATFNCTYAKKPLLYLNNFLLFQPEYS